MDIAELDPYIVIPLSDTTVEAHADNKLRIMADVAPGVSALWDDDEDTLVAFLFVRSFTEEQAKAWVAEAEKDGVNLVSFATQQLERLLSTFQSLPQALSRFTQHSPPQDNQNPTGLESFDAIRARVEAAISKLYDYTDADDRSHWAYVVDIGPEIAVFELDGLWWAVSYSINSEDAVLLGEPQPTERAWVDRETEKVVPLQLYTFRMRGALATEATEDIAGDGLLWKEVCKVGQWFRIDTGNLLSVTTQLLQDLVSSFVAKVMPNVSVPADTHHYDTGGFVPAEDNTGFVEQLKLIGTSLWAGLRITHQETLDKINDGSIKDVSICAIPQVHDPRTGEKWPWVLLHVLLTNTPQVPDLSPFTEAPVAASLKARCVLHQFEQQEDITMEPTNEPTLEQQTQLAAFQGLGLTVEQAAEWQKMGLSFDRVKQLVAEEVSTREKARALEVKGILLAMEGAGDHEGVTVIAGMRHYPVVCAAVEQALTQHAGPLALDVTGDGVTALDAVVLAVVNAIPEDGRLSLTAAPSGSKAGGDPADPPAPTDEQIDDLEERLR